MCIAILNKTSLLDFDTIKNSFDNNPDGAGLCAVIGGSLIVYKELKSKNAKSFYNKYVELRKKTDLPMLLHFRIGTSGVKDERNLHPFLINTKLALIHNGMITYNVVNKDYSDTWHFTQFLKALRSPGRLLNNKSMEYQMLSAFTKGSKIAILHVSGQYSILNESAGKWSGDTWYSNETYKSCNYRNIGGKIVYNNNADLWGYDNEGYFGYGRTYKAEPLIKDIPTIWIHSIEKMLTERDFSALSYNERQRKIIGIAKAIFGSGDIIFNAHSYTTVTNSLFNMFKSGSIYELYTELFTENKRIYSSIILEDS
jgi:hypothetical protein